jgi:hypothetical protein
MGDEETLSRSCEKNTAQSRDDRLVILVGEHQDSSNIEVQWGDASISRVATMKNDNRFLVFRYGKKFQQ